LFFYQPGVPPWKTKTGVDVSILEVHRDRAFDQSRPLCTVYAQKSAQPVLPLHTAMPNLFPNHLETDKLPLDTLPLETWRLPPARIQSEHAASLLPFFQKIIDFLFLGSSARVSLV
jgi:hypothetical protein